MHNRKQSTLIYGGITLVAVIGILITLFVMYNGGTYKKYTSAKYNFSMLYPDGWSMSEMVPGVAVQFFSPLESGTDPFKENVNIVYQDHAVMPMDLQKYTDTAIEQVLAVFKQNVQIITSEPTTLSGKPAYKFLYIGTGPNNFEIKIMHVWTTENNKAYQFTYAAYPYKFDKYWPKVRKMLGSFQIQ